MPAVAGSAGIPHCRYRTNRVAMSVGPGIVLTTARAARSAPTARRQPRAGMRMRVGPRVGDVADGGRDDQNRKLRRRQGRQGRPDRVVVDDVRQDADEDHNDDTEEERERPMIERRLGRVRWRDLGVGSGWPRRAPTYRLGPAKVIGITYFRQMLTEGKRRALSGRRRRLMDLAIFRRGPPPARPQ